MRLLEFNRDAGGANPRRTAVIAAAKRSAVSRQASPPAAKADKTGGLSRRFPLQGNAAVKPARHSPVDLETLQSRIHSLEQRVQQQTGRIERRARLADLEKLQGRMQQVEQSLHRELWAARQREHTMLEMLSKPPLKTRVRQQIRHLSQSGIPAAKRWARQAANTWWQDSQPGWWAKFAAAWQEALAQARR